MSAFAAAPLAGFEYALANAEPPPIPPKSSARKLQRTKIGTNNVVSNAGQLNITQDTCAISNGSHDRPHDSQALRPQSLDIESPSTLSYFSDDSSSDGSRNSAATSCGSAITQILANNLVLSLDEPAPKTPPALTEEPQSTSGLGDLTLRDEPHSLVQLPEFARAKQPLPLALTWNNIPPTKWEPARDSELWTPQSNAFNVPTRSSTADSVDVRIRPEDNRHPRPDVYRPVPTISVAVDTPRRDQFSYEPSRMMHQAVPRVPASRMTPRLQVPCHKRGLSEPLTRMSNQNMGFEDIQSPLVAKSRWTPTPHYGNVQAATPSTTDSMSSVPYETDEDGTWLSASPLDISPLTPQTMPRGTPAIGMQSPNYNIYSPQSRFSMYSDLEEDTKSQSPQASPFGLIQHGYVYDSVVPPGAAAKPFDESAVGENTLQWLGAQKKPSYHVRNNSASDRHHILGTYFRRSTISF